MAVVGIGWAEEEEVDHGFLDSVAGWADSGFGAFNSV